MYNAYVEIQTTRKGKYNVFLSRKIFVRSNLNFQEKILLNQ